MRMILSPTLLLSVLLCLIKLSITSPANINIIQQTKEPFFDISSNFTFIGQEGGNMFLSCTVYNLHNRSVSWVRKNDGYILAVDHETFISDPRFFATHAVTGLSDTWSLGIKHVTKEDEGRYECQVSSEIKLSREVELIVVTPQVTINEGEDMFVKSGSSVQIRCLIGQTVEPPPYVTWYFNGKMLVDFAGSHSSVTAASAAAASGVNPGTPGHALLLLQSVLKLRDVRKTDSGNYTCRPANLPSATAYLHVIQQEQEQRELLVTSTAPAAMFDTAADCPTRMGLAATAASLLHGVLAAYFCRLVY